jgi:MFS family permease
MLWFGPSMGLIVNTLIYLPLTIWLIRAPYTGHLQPGRSARRLRWSEAFSVMHEVADNRPVITMVVLGGAASLFIGNAFQAAMPEFAHDLGTTGADFTYSALLGANAAGAVVGGLLLDATGWLLPTVRSAIVCAMLWCGAMTVFAFSTSYPLALVMLFLAGVLNLAFYSIAQTIAQLEAPDHMRGRVIGLFSMSVFGLRAFSGLTVGVAGGVVGVHWSLALSAVSLFVITVALFMFTRPLGYRQRAEG